MPPADSIALPDLCSSPVAAPIILKRAAEAAVDITMPIIGVAACHAGLCLGRLLGLAAEPEQTRADNDQCQRARREALDQAAGAR
jgi:hypothetical protein